mmetsp:Transcript_21477/g.72817  ORF Transcript_21477/g.72817 Transcript_21477/m.72817 type:complete len:96 (+) Transcript_21477:369-656(+)
MQAWAVDQKVEGSILTFMGDPSSALTKALGTVLDDSRVMGVLGYARTKRFAAYLEDGVVKAFEVSEAPDDPAGDSFPEASCVENMLTKIPDAKEL